MTFDLEYTDNGMFTKFMPNTAAGEVAWNEMAKADADGVAAVLSIYAKSVIAQLRKAGYSVCKAKKAPAVTEEMLAELDAMLTN